MPSKHREKALKRKRRYSQNSEEAKSQAHSQYKQHRHAVIQRSKLRLLTDQTLRRSNAINVKRRLVTDATYRQENIKRAKLSQKRRLQTDKQYRLKKQLQAKLNKNQ